MTEYRLVPVEPTEEMIEAARPWPTHWGDRALASNEQKAAYLADHMTVASDYRAMLSAAPPAHTREAIAALIEHHVAGEVRGPREGWIELVGVREAADAILSLLGRQPSPPHHKGLSI